MRTNATTSTPLAPTLFDDQAARRPGPELTVVSAGGGQDSGSLLYRLCEDEAFRAEWAPNTCIAVCSDTGDEFEATYEHIEDLKTYTPAHGIAFYHLTSDLGYHTGEWTSLRDYYNARSACGSKSYPKTCTSRLKIGPIYSFLEDYLAERYVLGSASRKRAFYEFAERYGRLRVVIGFGADERDRIGSGKDDPKWMRECVEKVFPLVDLGWTRRECQEYIRSLGRTLMPPSNCKLCPWLSEIELIYLWRFHRADFDDWVRIEANKLAKFAHLGEKNLGVWGSTKRLPEILERALAKHSEYAENDELLLEYRMSHGHCTRSKY
jgi:3'-phosphoadenosine 5'-phosphosulfate sulfotransferase (PAPS reductase)/FAD synthetase